MERQSKLPFGLTLPDFNGPKLAAYDLGYNEGISVTLPELTRLQAELDVHRQCAQGRSGFDP